MKNVHVRAVPGHRTSFVVVPVGKPTRLRDDALLLWSMSQFAASCSAKGDGVIERKWMAEPLAVTIARGVGMKIHSTNKVAQCPACSKQLCFGVAQT
eukprot:5901570-Amphidinium_carterae.1